jgi:hypothetical protein
MLSESDGLKILRFKTRNSNGESLYIVSSSVVLDSTKPVLVDSKWDAETTTMTWAFFDTSPSSYSVLVNGTVQFTNDWNGGSLIVDFSYLDYGTYNLTIIVYDKVDYHTINSNIVEIPEPIIPTTPTPTETTDSNFSLVFAILPLLVIYYDRRKRKRTKS